MPIAASELILNDDGSIYHLNLLPGDMATTIITVGDQERVHEVSKHFESIEIKKQKREFTCHTGMLRGKRISVISTGIGTDNIDIVFNEIDALFNINFDTRQAKDEITILDFIRLGTSGSIQSEIPLGTLLASEVAVGIDNMNAFYAFPHAMNDENLAARFQQELGSHFNSYAIKANVALLKAFSEEQGFMRGKTLTSIGFYGPQGRSIRTNLLRPGFISKIARAEITNLEMETAGIYLLAAALGHRAISINAILANRRTGEFTEAPGAVVEGMIEKALDIILDSIQ